MKHEDEKSAVAMSEEVKASIQANKMIKNLMLMIGVFMLFIVIFCAIAPYVAMSFMDITESEKEKVFKEIYVGLSGFSRVFLMNFCFMVSILTIFTAKNIKAREDENLKELIKSYSINK